MTFLAFQSKVATV